MSKVTNYKTVICFVEIDPNMHLFFSQMSNNRKVNTLCSWTAKMDDDL